MRKRAALGIFKDAQEVYEHLGTLMRAVMADEELGPRMRRADLVLRQEFSDPEAVITVSLDDPEGGVEFGPGAPERAGVKISMDADVAHRFWLGQVDVGAALARGEIRAVGPIEQILQLVPLTAPAVAIYRRQLIEQGREDLAGSEPVRPAAHLAL